MVNYLINYESGLKEKINHILQIGCKYILQQTNETLEIVQ